MPRDMSPTVMGAPSSALAVKQNSVAKGCMLGIVPPVRDRGEMTQCFEVTGHQL